MVYELTGSTAIDSRRFPCLEGGQRVTKTTQGEQSGSTRPILLASLRSDDQYRVRSWWLRRAGCLLSLRGPVQPQSILQIVVDDEVEVVVCEIVVLCERDIDFVKEWLQRARVQ